MQIYERHGGEIENIKIIKALFGVAYSSSIILSVHYWMAGFLQTVHAIQTELERTAVR